MLSVSVGLPLGVLGRMKRDLEVAGAPDSGTPVLFHLLLRSGELTVPVRAAHLRSSCLIESCAGSYLCSVGRDFDLCCSESGLKERVAPGKEGVWASPATFGTWDYFGWCPGWRLGGWGCCLVAGG